MRFREIAKNEDQRRHIYLSVRPVPNVRIFMKFDMKYFGKSVEKIQV
jgi:hypothetical protein